MPGSTCPIPEITQEDIAWVEGFMKLDIDSEREHFLKSRESMDVAACPGSGKTTLVVAKLAMLARKWPYRSRGMCILSHTNVAREEIESRLGKTAVGQLIFSYPHFIGTIHSFANRFLALPYLNAHGYPVPTVDNDIACAYRRSVLPRHALHNLEFYLKNKFLSLDKLRLASHQGDFLINQKSFPDGTHTTSYQKLAKIVEETVKAGYFCFDEMFVWANALLTEKPNIPAWLAQRFPYILIDEVQDTNVMQGSLLRRIFPANGTAVMQRVGDDNQAIFNSHNEKGDDDLNFPCPDCHSITSSFRFGQDIAKLAHPFAQKAVNGNLCGRGPKVQFNCPCPHTIFIFPKEKAEQVLQKFGEHVLATFTDEQLAQGHQIVAVGAVHKLEEENMDVDHNHYPKRVSHYWPPYSPKNSNKTQHPQVLAHYLMQAQSLVQAEQNTADAVEKIAYGIVRLCRKAGEPELFKGNAHFHRNVVKKLTEDTAHQEAISAYRTLLTNILLRQTVIDEAGWNSYVTDFCKIARCICTASLNRDQCGSFLAWPATGCQTYEVQSAQQKAFSNIYTAESDGRSVSIHLSSIHAIKGQTHLATLVLDTFNRTHFFKKLSPWLYGKKCHSVTDDATLKLAYVAMTRPTHLLCLAIPDTSLGKEASLGKNIAKLREFGWKISHLE